MLSVIINPKVEFGAFLSCFVEMVNNKNYKFQLKNQPRMKKSGYFSNQVPVKNMLDG